MLTLTPQRLAAVYECLRSFPPFSKWGIPSAEEVAFAVSHSRKNRGAYWHDGTQHWIEVSAKNIGHFTSLAMVMAHEMVHLYQKHAKTETPNTVHNAQFHKIAAVICKRFGWDVKLF